MQLRSYQATDIRKAAQELLLGSQKVTGLVWGTGLGKTLAAAAIVSEVLRSPHNSFTHIMIVAPQKTLVRQFGKYSDLTRTFTYRSHCGIQGEVVRVKCVSDSKADRDDLYNSWAQQEDLIPRVTTHQRLVMEIERILQFFGPESGKKLLLIIDEYHHTDLKGKTRLGNLIHQRLETSVVKVLGLTATAFRPDGSKVFSEGDLVLERPLPQMMITGFAPEELKVEFCKSNMINLNGLTTEDLDEGCVQVVNPAVLARQVVEVWERHNLGDLRIPVLIRFRGATKEINVEVVGELHKAFIERGLSAIDIVNAYGDEGDPNLTSALTAEDRARCINEIKPVIIALNRATEGMDSPARCLGISIGIPRSQVLLVQLIGRIMRLRLNYLGEGCLDADGNPNHEAPRVPILEGLPEEWIRCSKQIFITGTDSIHPVEMLSTFATLGGYHVASLVRKCFEVTDSMHLLGKVDIGNAESKSNEVFEDLCKADQLVRNARGWWFTQVSPESDCLTKRGLYLFSKSYEEVHYARCQEEARGENDPPYTPCSSKAILTAINLILAEQHPTDALPAKAVRDALLGVGDEESLHELENLCSEYQIANPTTFDGSAIDLWGAQYGVLASGGVRRRRECIPDTLQDLERFLTRFLEREGRYPTFKDPLVKNLKPTWALVNTKLKDGVFGETFVGGLPHYLVVKRELDWKALLEEASVRRKHLILLNRKAWEQDDNKTCPVCCYLKELIGKPLTGLTLEQACLMTPKQRQNWSTNA